MRKIRFLIYIILLVAAWVFISFYGGPFPYMIFYTVVAILPTAVCYIWYTHRHIRIYQELEQHKVMKGEIVDYQILIENTGFLPIVEIELTFEEELTEIKDLEGKRKIHLMPGEKINMNFPMICRYAGTYYIGIKSFQVSDIFGLFARKFPMLNRFRASVRPRITNQAEAALCFENLLNSTGIKSYDMKENLLSHELRSYVRGDSLKQIHWKNSAKKQELFVRKQEPTDMLRIMIVMETGVRSDDVEAVKRKDLFLEFAVSTAYYFCLQNKPITFLYKKITPVLKLVDSYDSFYQFYEDIADGLAYRQENEVSVNKIEEIKGKNAGLILLLKEDEFPSGEFLTKYQEVEGL